MRVTTLGTTDAIISQIDALSTQQATLQTEVSSGQTITNPEDNPSGFNTALGLENDLSQLQQYGSNASHALITSQDRVRSPIVSNSGTAMIAADGTP